MTDALSDTGEMAMLTGRAEATIRYVLRGLRRPGGYDHHECAPLLAAHPREVVALTAAEAHQYLGITPDRIYQWVHRQRLAPVDKVGRVTRYAADDLVRLRNREDRRAQLDL